jgi:peptidoglycan/LPS O-acetylase OafA/YrhL
MAVGAVNSTPKAAPASRDATFYRPEPDILRLLAFLGVYISHSLPVDQKYLSRNNFRAGLLRSAMSDRIAPYRS